MIKIIEIDKASLDMAGNHQQDFIMQCMREKRLPIVRYVDNDGNIEYSTDVEVKIAWLARGGLRFTWDAKDESLDSLG